ncbi:MAG TPA: M28 family peptidase [Candidatus Polarisedimenticolaceae bacterium]
MRRSLAAAAVVLLAVPAIASDLLIRLERRAGDDLARLRAAGLPVVHETLGALFLEGDEATLGAARAAGFQARVLDDRAGASDYLQVGIRPDSDLESLRRFGAEIWAEENWRLLRVPRGAPLERLPEARVFVGRLPHRPFELPANAPVRSRAGNDAPNPLIQKMVAAVASADVDAYWTDLVTNPPTNSRYSSSAGATNAANYVASKFAAMGMPSQFQTYSASNAPNVVGTHGGGVTPGRVYLVIGHLDDLPYWGVAPGADDNASGSVTVIESAKVMSCWGFKSTVKFVTVTGEELGLLGSEAYAADAAARGEDIRGVLNFDMNGWAGDGVPAGENLDVNYNATSQWLGELFAQCAQEYATGVVVDAFSCPSLNASDHYPFWQRGWPAICGITDNEGYCGHTGYYPYYHTRSDTIPNCGNRSFFYGTIRATVATAATLAEPFKVTFRDTSVDVGAPAWLVVADRGPNTNPGSAQTLTVEVWSAAEPGPETVTLTEDGVNSMFFRGSIATTAEPAVHGDGKVSLREGDVLQARYIDASDCDGASNVAYTVSSSVVWGAKPAEVAPVALLAGPPTRLTWPPVPGAVRYDVASGALPTTGLHDASCGANDLLAEAWDDARPDPGAGAGYWYLVRGENAFGSGTWGSGSDAAPRTIAACP